MCHKFAFGLMILSFTGELRLIFAHPNYSQSNGHVPDRTPVFHLREVYGIQFRFGVAVSPDYGEVPSNDQREKDRLSGLAGGRDSNAGPVAVYSVFVTDNPATRRTVNAFLCFDQGNTYMLLAKTADSVFDKIKYTHYLSDADVAALEQRAAQQAAGQQ